MSDNRPARWTDGQMAAYRMGMELGSDQPGRAQYRRRREVILTEDSITLVEEVTITEERYW